MKSTLKVVRVKNASMRDSTSHLRLRVDPRVICLMYFARSIMPQEKEQILVVSTLLSSVLGLFGSELVTKINQEINTKNLTKVKHCKVGLEVHFKEAEGCIDPKSRRRRKRASVCAWCLFCWSTKLYN